MFTEIITHDLRRPLPERRASRRICGPYRWRPTEAGQARGRGFYMGRGDGFSVDPAGSTFDLRIVPATEILRDRRIATSHSFNEFGDSYEAIVARLPRGRGYLAGATLGEGMASFVELRVFDDIEDAAWDATETARIAADREAEYQAELDEAGD